MSIINYNKKLTNLQLKLFNYLAEEHNPAFEFFISVLFFILERILKIIDLIQDILIVPIFKMLSFFIVLILLLFNLVASIPTIHRPSTTAIVTTTTVNYPVAIIDKNTNIIAISINNIPPPIKAIETNIIKPLLLEEKKKKPLLLEEKTLLMLPFKAVETVEAEEKVIDEIENIINPYVKEAVKKKREQLSKIEKYKGTLLDIDKIKNCAVDLTIPNNSKPITFYCGNRFCPTCASIKAGKNADIIKRVLLKARENKKTLLYGTFTTKNVTSDKLLDEVNRINTAFTKTLTVPKKLKDNIVGYVKKLEIKYNPINNDYNVHIHTAIAVINHYKNHISIDEYHEYFKRYTKDNDIIKPDIKVIGKTDKDITKVSNYLAKEDLIQNLSFSDEISDNIFNAVKNKRLLEFCLLFREFKKEAENILTTNKVSIRKNQMPILTNLTWDNNKKIYIN